MTQPAMTDLPRIRKRPLDAVAHTSGPAADEIDIAGCATIAYSSEDPAHPVEHLPDAHSGQEPRVGSARAPTQSSISSRDGKLYANSQRARSNRPRSDTGIKECRSTPKGVGRYPPGGTGDASRKAVDQMVVPKAA
jgi:hypothetical protein